MMGEREIEKEVRSGGAIEERSVRERRENN